jgi:hypothetical protein
MIEKEENEIYVAEEVFVQCANCHSKITFTDEGLLLGSKPHNRLLFVSCYICEEKVSRILIDDGSAVNIMSKVTMNALAYLWKSFLRVDWSSKASIKKVRGRLEDKASLPRD